MDEPIAAMADHGERSAASGGYVLHARRLVGTLEAPIRNDTESWSASTLASAETWAAERTTRGFTVWIYDHSRAPGVVGASDLAVVAVRRPRDR